jgi:hypothetical protein
LHLYVAFVSSTVTLCVVESVSCGVPIWQRETYVYKNEDWKLLFRWRPPPSNKLSGGAVASGRDLSYFRIHYRYTAHVFYLGCRRAWLGRVVRFAPPARGPDAGLACTCAYIPPVQHEPPTTIISPARGAQISNGIPAFLSLIIAVQLPPVAQSSFWANWVESDPPMSLAHCMYCDALGSSSFGCSWSPRQLMNSSRFRCIINMPC